MSSIVGPRRARPGDEGVDPNAVAGRPFGVREALGNRMGLSILIRTHDREDALGPSRIRLVL